MKNSKYKLILSVFAICGVISLLITIGLAYYYQSKRSKILGLSDFSSPIQVISNISSSFPEPDFSFDNPTGVAVDAQGNIYVTDLETNLIQKYDIGTSIWTIIGSEGFALGEIYGPSGIDIDTSGNIYVTEWSSSRIQKYNIGTTTWEVIGSAGSAVGQFDNPRGITVDTSGNIYVADTNNFRIQKYNIGTTTWEVIGSAGVAVGEFIYPSGISIDTSNNIFVADSGNNRIQKYNIGTTTWEAMGSYGSAVGQFNNPYDITIDNSDDIYVTDSCNGRIQKYSNDSQTWLVIGDSNDICLNPTFNGVTDKILVNLKKIFDKFFNQILAVAILEDFDDLRGIAVDLQGNVYVADSGNHRIQKYDPETTNWTAMGSQGSAIGQFNEPHGISLDTYGNVYVTDSGNHRIQKYDIGTTTWIEMGGEGSDIGQFYYPIDLSIDNNGNIYVTDSDNSRIQKYDIGTTAWTTMGSYGSEVGQFKWPTGIVIDNNSNIYIVDTENHRIQKYDIGTTTWSVIGSVGSEVGQFNYPNGITIDSIGNIFVADTANHRIQKYDIGTSTWTTMGSEGSGVGEFNNPKGIDTDNLGNIYVADTANHRIQKYDIGTTTWSAIGEYNGPIIDNVISYSNPNGFFNKLTYLFNNLVRKVLATISVYFYNPMDLVVDSVGNVYVVDGGNNRIQKLIYYSAPTFTINYSALENGSITGTTTQSISVGQSSTPVVAIGNEGYSFLQWSDGSITNPRFDVVEDDDISLTAEFTNTRTISDVDATKINNEISREFINIGSTDPTLVSNFTFNINYTFLTGSASIVFPAQTVVAPIGASTVDLTQFRTINNTTEIKTKLDNTISSLQFGIPNINLTFSKPVTVIIPVSSNYNNQTLQVKYHRDGDPENIWNNETTCLITNSNCTFQTTHATTFAVLKNTTQTPNNTSSPANYVQDHNCHSTKPLLTSDLFQIDALSNKAKIYFTPQTDTNDYFISFSSINNNAEEHGEKVTLLREGVQSHTIYSLKPNTTYYVKVRGQNGCMPGNWSNIMQFKTNSRIYYRYSVTTKANNIIKNTTNTVKKSIINAWNTIILPKTFGD
ncbi:MAG: SMP-30/gluconolactonase/LRE family protein [Candidatus Shapirobacteria bacterium]|nr:SMP-30/gluconolactonase/LRE family protein [Candidatus Shapirobacteria bacterium]